MKDFNEFINMKTTRITIFAGHYGSGKTSLAVNYVLELKKRYDKVIIADLDIVNPYFRTKDSAEVLENAGIRLISSACANSNVDVPAMAAETNVIFDEPDSYAVIDLGGDDRGANALGRYSGRILKENDFSMLLVINMYRPLSRDVESALEIKDEIEKAARLKFTGIVNNSNLGYTTTVRDVLDSAGYAEGISELTGLPVLMTSAKKEIAGELGIRVNNIFNIDLEDYQWQRSQR